MPELKTREPETPGASQTEAAEEARVARTTARLVLHRTGSVPLAGAEEVFRRDQRRKLGEQPAAEVPDGETGPRSDGSSGKYPVFSALPQFVVGPPGDETYRTLPKLRLRAGLSLRR